jgi:hypothetical protein
MSAIDAPKGKVGFDQWPEHTEIGIIFEVRKIH